MTKTLDKAREVDQGIDFENYNLQEEIEKYKGDSPRGYQIVIRVYIPKVKEKIGSIYLANDTAEKISQDNKFMNFTGLVVKLPNNAYTDPIFDRTGPYCKVGDWVMFPRAHGNTYSYNGLTSITLNEDAVLKVIDDPRKVTRLLA